MADYGVTPEGFIRMRLPEIREAIVEAMRGNLRSKGLPDNIETRPDSVTGVLIDTFADREAAIWELSEGVYYAMYPGSAFGASLDRAVSFSGVRRLAAEPSEALVVAYGLEGTVIPVGSQVRNRVSQGIWQTVNAITIAKGAASDITLTPTIANSALYRVTINGVNYSYTSPASGNSIATVLAGIVAALLPSPMEVSSNGSAVRLQSVSQNAVNLSTTANLTASQLGTSVLVRTVDAIPESAAAGDLNAIVTMVPGWQAVTNPVAAAVGRREESDAELRTRYRTGVFRLGGAVLPSIAPNIVNEVPGLIDIRVFENDTDGTVNGRLPHSIHVIVEGGLEDNIARAIYNYKAAGIDTNGAITKVLQTDEGEQIIKFDRPTPVYVWVKAEVTLLPAAEQSFPSNGFDLIENAIATTGAAQEIGMDVVLQRFFGPIYNAAPGIASVTLRFYGTTNPATVPSDGAYTATNITITEVQKAVFDPTRIFVS